jgi:hypothetical protein
MALSSRSAVLAGTQVNVTLTFSGGYRLWISSTESAGCARGKPLRVLKRTQEIQDVLLLALRQLAKRFPYNSIRFGPRTPVLLYGTLQISGSSVVKKKDALSEPPQGPIRPFCWALKTSRSGAAATPLLLSQGTRSLPKSRAPRQRTGAGEHSEKSHSVLWVSSAREQRLSSLYRDGRVA